MPPASDDVVTETGGGLTVSESAAVAATDALSVTRTVKLLDPAALGVPEIVPPAESSIPPAAIRSLPTTYREAIRRTRRAPENRPCPRWQPAARR